MLKVVCDTNVLVSAFLFNGNERRLLDLQRQGSFELCTSPALLDELVETFSKPKFRLPPEEPLRLVRSLSSVCNVVHPVRVIHFVEADPDDDVVLECAVAAAADIIISGDHHLLGLGRFEGIPILQCRAFLERFRF